MNSQRAGLGVPEAGLGVQGGAGAAAGTVRAIKYPSVLSGAPGGSSLLSLHPTGMETTQEDNTGGRLRVEAPDPASHPTMPTTSLSE